MPSCRSPTSQACSRCSLLERTCKSGRPPGAGAIRQAGNACPWCVRRPAKRTARSFPGEFRDRYCCRPAGPEQANSPVRTASREARSQPSATSGMEAMPINSGIGELQKIHMKIDLLLRFRRHAHFRENGAPPFYCGNLYRGPLLRYSHRHSVATTTRTEPLRHDGLGDLVLTAT